jgi:hypothetical protein
MRGRGGGGVARGTTADLVTLHRSHGRAQRPLYTSFTAFALNKHLLTLDWCQYTQLSPPPHTHAHAQAAYTCSLTDIWCTPYEQIMCLRTYLYTFYIFVPSPTSFSSGPPAHHKTRPPRHCHCNARERHRGPYSTQLPYRHNTRIWGKAS